MEVAIIAGAAAGVVITPIALWLMARRVRSSIRSQTPTPSYEVDPHVVQLLRDRSRKLRRL